MPEITGYRVLTQQEIDIINEGKALAEQVRAYAAKLQATNDIDHRWLNIGVTHLQQGFMALTRSIAQPTTF